MNEGPGLQRSTVSGSVRRAARRLVVTGLLGSTALGVLGQVVRDRSAAWAVLMYLPLTLIGTAAIGFDLVCLGRAWRVPKMRFALASVGMATVLGAATPLIGWGSGRGDLAATGASKPGRMFSVLHWNVVWGGGRRRNVDRWASIRRTIAAQRADIVVLGEAPPDDWLDQMVADLGPTGSRVQIENEPGASDWYKLVVGSSKPVRLVRREPVSHGAAMVVEVGTGVGGDLVRLLVVDGQSHPLRWRTPFLLDVARLCHQADEAGRPFDLVVGDFNSLARSIGFDALADEGYALASRSTLGTWRGTFPSFAPVYDIDHIWVRRDRWPDLRSRSFTDLASDHRGMVARLWGFRPGPRTTP